MQYAPFLSTVEQAEALTREDAERLGAVRISADEYAPLLAAPA